MKVFTLLNFPSRVASDFARWATRPLVLEKKGDYKRITDYGLWREVTLGSRDYNVYEGLTDKKHIVIYEGNSLVFDPKKDRTFMEFQSALRCVVNGNIDSGQRIHNCFNDRLFPKKPSNTLLLIEGLERTSPWLLKFIEKGGRVWKLPTFQDAAVELLGEGAISENDIRNLLLTKASYQIQASGIQDFNPLLVETNIHMQGIDELVDLVNVWAQEQYLRAYYFRDLLALSEVEFQSSDGASLGRAKETYLKVIQRANDIRSRRIKEAMHDGAGSLLILTDMDHEDVLISKETKEKIRDRNTFKLLNGEPYRGHNLVTYLFPQSRYVDLVSGN